MTKPTVDELIRNEIIGRKEAAREVLAQIAIQDAEGNRPPEVTDLYVRNMRARLFGRKKNDSNQGEQRHEGDNQPG